MRPSLRTAAYLAVILAALSVVLHEMGGTARATGSQTIVVGVAGQAYELFSSDGGIYQSNDFVTYHQIGSLGPIVSSPVVVSGRPGGGYEVILSPATSWYGIMVRCSLLGNVFSGPATAVLESVTWSAIKGRFGH